MIVIDTTVLVYAKGLDHPLRDPCRQLVRGIEHGDIEATTTVEAIQEFGHVRAWRRDRKDATDLARAYADMLAPLLVVGESDLRDGLHLFERHPALGCFDAVLAAVARSVGAEALVSADSGFDAVPQLVHVVPDSDGVESLLSSPPR